MRTFFCLPLDHDVRSVLARAAAQLRRETRMAASWVDPENYHVTLRFLGETNPHAIADLEQLASRVAASCLPFTLRLHSIGAFPSLDRARVLWVGGETPEEFQTLASTLERGVVELGFPAEPKPAVAHVTVARLKGAPDPRLANLVTAMGSLSTRDCDPYSIALMESELTPKGARYAPLFSVPIPSQKAA